MKILKLIFIVLVFASFVFVGCTNPADNGSGSDGTEEPGETDPEEGENNPGGGDVIAINRSIEVSDSEGNLLGYLVSETGSLNYLIMTESGYLAEVDIMGELQYNEELKFTEIDLGGSCYLYFYMDGMPDNLNAKRLFSDGTRLFEADVIAGTLYVYFANMTEQEITYNSYYNYSGIYNYSEPQTRTGKFLAMRESSSAEVTALKDISGPLSFSLADSE